MEKEKTQKSLENNKNKVNIKQEKNSSEETKNLEMDKICQEEVIDKPKQESINLKEELDELKQEKIELKEVIDNLRKEKSKLEENIENDKIYNRELKISIDKEQENLNTITEIYNNLKKNSEQEYEEAKKEQKRKLKKEYNEEKKKQQISLKKEYELTKQSYDNEIKDSRIELEKNRNDLESFDNREKELNKRKIELLEREKLVEYNENKVEKKFIILDEIIAEEKDSLNNEEIIKKDNEIKALENNLEIYKKECEELRKKLSLKNEKELKTENALEILGEDPQIFLEKNMKLEEQYKEIKDQLVNAVPREEYLSLESENKELKSEKEELKTLNKELYSRIEELDGLEYENNNLKHNINILEQKNENIEYENEMLKNENEKVKQENLRLTTPESRTEEFDKQFEEIKNRGPLNEKDMIGAGKEKDSRKKCDDEISWLENILKKCDEYKFKLNKSVLYAFHTALKVNEWSTITVLSGVSGTGKSELPRLYAAFGGLNYCSVAVQPNWDSQESMLGFYNSIDNRFEPEEVLSFLIQCTADKKYNEYMSLVLLDEMNLSHVEYYFAEFLSKLEARRGVSDENLPEIKIKLASGVEPYGLKLERNILWSGTMNQDETTMSLSDKVIDRGIIINFPRPNTLESISKRGKIEDIIKDNRPKLHRETWEKWICNEIMFSEEQQKEINKYKEMVQEINNALEKVGRALGHRVWQSIEYYIANYPLVRKEMKYKSKKGKKEKYVPTNTDLNDSLKSAMKTAFEDQIVQKIMPKLRGINTNEENGKKCLNQIEKILQERNFDNLLEDFKIAREQGYGQFMWSSAKYLDNREEK